MTTDTTPPPPWTRESNLKCLLLTYWATPGDTQEEDDAFNYLCDAIEEAMTEEQAESWHEWNLKATQDEIIVNGLDMLGLQEMQQEAWEEHRANFHEGRVQSGPEDWNGRPIY